MLAIATFAYVQGPLRAEPGVATAARVGLFNERVARGTCCSRPIEQASVSAAPKRRSNGLEKIKEAAELEPEPDRRTRASRLGGEVLDAPGNRIEHRGARNRAAHGLVFTPGGDQLALLSDEDDTLAFWDVRKGRQLATLPLRSGAGTFPQAVAEAGIGESAGNRPEPSGAGGGAGAASGRRLARGPEAQAADGAAAGYLDSAWPRSVRSLRQCFPANKGWDCLTSHQVRRCAP